MQRGFPTASIAAVLDLAGLAPGDVDCVAVAGRYGRGPLRLLDRRYAQSRPGPGPNEWPQRAYRHYENLVGFLPGARQLEARIGLKALRAKLRNAGIDRAVPVRLIPHHAAHAACAATLFEDDALIVTMDGYGDGTWATVYRKSGSALTLLHRCTYVGSIAVTYGSVCQLLGFGEGDEGKLTALAASGNPEELAPFFERKLGAPGGIRISGGPLSPRQARYLLAHPREHVAAAMQQAAEHYVVQFIRPFVRDSCTTRIGLAGGLFANVSINARIVGAFPEHSVRVFPAMGDQGLSVGAAVLQQGGDSGNNGLPVFSGPFLGMDVDLPDLESSTFADLDISRTSLPAKECALALAEDRTAALVSGREEFGPRALGNRSLLFPATSRELAERVQAMLRRSPVMPFAPACRDDSVDDLFLPPYPAADDDDRGLGLMTFAVKATREVQNRFPAAVHLDGTSRVQVVTRLANPMFYRVLLEYEQASGNPLLMNTSFNLHGQPIVHGADDALATFAETGVDLMLLRDYVVKRREQRS